MPRGPADRPIRQVDDEVALQAALRRALEQGAAPAIVRFMVPDPPAFGTQVAATTPARAALGVSRTRGARAIALPRRTRKKAAAPVVSPPDPRGRGRSVDLRS